MTTSKTFGGDKKVGGAISGKLERRFIDWAVPRLPAWLRSTHLTLATLPISLGVIFFSFQAQWNINWLWIVSALIVLQWLTDSLDGSLGKYRQEGLIRWGYYMDHFLDYIFLASLLIGYAILLPPQFIYIHFLTFVILSAFMVSSFLAFGATNKFQIAFFGIGPTEIRAVFIIINILYIIFGRTYLAFFTPYVLLTVFIGLCILVYKTQKQIHAEDIAAKK